MRRYEAEPIDQKNIDDIIYMQREMDVENARDFFRTGERTYRSLDPRLIDPVRNIHMELDAPPLQPRDVQPLRNLYGDCNNHIKPGFYRDYASIYPGDVRYYVDPSMAQAFNEPVYIIKSAVVPFVFQDPMGGLKVQYDKIPLFKNQENISEYTFDQDQMSFREDITSRLSRKMNQNDFNMYVGHFPNQEDVHSGIGSRG